MNTSYPYGKEVKNDSHCQFEASHVAFRFLWAAKVIQNRRINRNKTKKAKLERIDSHRCARVGLLVFCCRTFSFAFWFEKMRTLNSVRFKMNGFKDTDGDGYQVVSKNVVVKR